MTQPDLRNIISVSWGDQLTFGEGDGLLDTKEALRRRAPVWCDELGAGTLHWRSDRTFKEGRYRAARGYRSAIRKMRHTVDWDDYAEVPTVAHELGMKAYLYLSLFDEGRPLPPKKERAVSFHNEMHAQHVAWQSDFSRDNPEYTMVDRSGQRRQWGVLCLAYPEVREHLLNRFRRCLDGYEFDGLFLCMRSQARPADFADQFGFNEPVRQEYLARYGQDICTQDFDVQLWRDLLGEYLTRFLTELRQTLSQDGTRLAIGCARGDVLGPPLGNATLQWQPWVEQGLVDELVINQNSSQCPSLWHQLWPMHRGYGYIHNYLDGYNMPPLREHLAEYTTALQAHSTKLYVARQWDERSEEEEEEILSQPVVQGLAFSSFRFDNPGPLARGDWVISP